VPYYPLEIMSIQNVKAVLFDMDGTILVSEGITERAVDRLLSDRGIQHADLDYAPFHGITWVGAEELLRGRFPELGDGPLTTALQSRFHAAFVKTFPPLIGGAHEAILAAGAAVPTGIVTSSNRETLEYVVDYLDLREHLRLTISAEDISCGKPDPECYVLAAHRLGVAREACLVFEDSLAGLRAAKAAGMMAIAVTERSHGATLDEARRLADHHIHDFTALADGFFGTITGAQLR